MTLVAREIFLVDQEVVIGVQLPEPAVKDIEMLVTEVLSHFVYVLLSAYMVQYSEEV